MRKAKHTSGPWLIDNSTDSVNGLDLDAISVVQKNGEQWCVAAVWTDLPDIKEASANARLIAAAPEMLEMLKSCLAFVDVLDLHGIVDNWSERPKLVELIKKIEK